MRRLRRTLTYLLAYAKIGDGRGRINGVDASLQVRFICGQTCSGAEPCRSVLFCQRLTYADRLLSTALSIRVSYLSNKQNRFHCLYSLILALIKQTVYNVLWFYWTFSILEDLADKQIINLHIFVAVIPRCVCVCFNRGEVSSVLRCRYSRLDQESTPSWHHQAIWQHEEWCRRHQNAPVLFRDGLDCCV